MRIGPTCKPSKSEQEAYIGEGVKREEEDECVQCQSSEPEPERGGLLLKLRESGVLKLALTRACLPIATHEFGAPCG